MNHPHRKEIIKLANADFGTKVWCQMPLNKTWDILNTPSWNPNCVYIVDNEYAELRKAEHDGAIIEARINHASTNSCSYGEEAPWNTNYSDYYWECDIGVENFRIKSEFEYPLYRKSKETGNVVKFTSLQEGIVLEGCERIDKPTGFKSNSFVAHTDTNNWEKSDYTGEVFLYKWVKDINGTLVIADYHTERDANKHGYDQTWTKVESSKITIENCSKKLNLK